jgi:hypothetical protein
LAGTLSPERRDDPAKEGYGRGTDAVLTFNLGSISVIADENGVVQERLSYNSACQLELTSQAWSRGRDPAIAMLQTRTLKPRRGARI